MSIDRANQSTLVELARVQREHEDLRRYVVRLREQCALAFGYIQALAKNPHRANADILATGLRAVLAGEIEPQDQIADAAEDEAFRAAVARMEAAEAREDAADARGKPE